MNKLGKAAATMAVILWMGFSGCATQSKPFEFKSDNDHMRGPGLLSGEDGHFSIRRQAATPDDKTVADADSGEETDKQGTQP